MATGILKNWCVWTIDYSEDERANFLRQMPQSIPAFITGEVVEDLSLRFPAGHRIRSSSLVGFDLQHMRAVTQNSVYLLRGQGIIERKHYPGDLAFAIELTIRRIIEQQRVLN